MAAIRRKWLLIALMIVVVASAFAMPSTAGPRDGVAKPTKAVSITLHGSMTGGWGWAATNITSPGPPLSVDQGDVITFTLFSQDSTPHTLVIDLNGNGAKDAGDLESSAFSSPTTGVTFVYTASTAGTLQYYCGLHGVSIMKGTLTVRSTSTPAPAGDNTLLYAGIGIVVVVVVGGLVAITRRKKPGSPPQP